jgi:hypothetical protein
MKNLKIKLLLTFIIPFFYIGCSDDDDPVTPPPGADTTAVNYNNLIISERTIPFDLALSAVDFFSGEIVRDSSRMKDANIVDSLFLGDSVFYFRSGELSDFPTQVPGYRTRFVMVALHAAQSEFDTMKVIPDSDNKLTENDFTMDNTNSFTAPLLFNSVYGFYLKGKFDNNVTPYPVFGLLYLDEAYYDPTGFKLRFDIKINKLGENRFRSQ